MGNVYKGLIICRIKCTLTSKEVVLWLRRLLGDLWRRGPGFSSRIFIPGYLVEKCDTV